MVNKDLAKRYIYAVTCNLPAKTQPEVEKEIDSMITELLDARCCGAEPGDEDIRAVLTELGPPEELAVKYSGEENKALISGIYLLWYKKMLRIVLPIAAAGVAFASLLSGFVKWQPAQEMYGFIPEIISTVLSGAFSAVVQAFMWVTIVFIIVERKNVRFSGDDFLSKLRSVPDKRAQIKIHEPVINILWQIAVFVLLLGFPYLIGGYTKGTDWIPAFDGTYIQASWYLIVIWTVVGISREIAKLIERRYSRRLALITVISHILTGASSALFLASSRIMNPVFTDNIASMIEGPSAEGLGKVLSHVNLFILAAVLLTLVVDVCVTLFRAFRYD